MQTSQEEPAAMPKKKADNDNFWELMGKCVTGFALAGAITGAATSVVLETVVNDKPLKEVSGEKAMRAAFDHAQGLALTGIFIVALMGAFTGQGLKPKAQKAEEPKPEEEKPEAPSP